MGPADLQLVECVVRALREDLGEQGDVTARVSVDPARPGSARIVAKAAGVIAGTAPARAAFAALAHDAVLWSVDDGARVTPGDVVLRVQAPAAAILAAERTALNFLGRLCGIATFTRRFVHAVEGTGCHVVDTRKTLPGWRVLDKYAAAVGGAENHRMGLYDAVLIKDNHIEAAGSVAAAVAAVRTSVAPHLRVQVEVESEAQAEEALAAGADWLLLDNRSLDELRVLAKRFRERALLEASGGVTLEGVRAVAETGVHRISIGALTHAAPSADVALDVVQSAV